MLSTIILWQINNTVYYKQTSLVLRLLIFDDDLSLQSFFALNGKSSKAEKKQIAGTVVCLQQFLMIIRPNRFPCALRVTNRTTILFFSPRSNPIKLTEIFL